ncbi:hypothetical protein N0V90_001118 [Kalmusia sp. IMI 367209]|nr:hypothetical protein N0V90_001118 [Kalmusia sp. IMI 367209]
MASPDLPLNDSLVYSPLANKDIAQRQYLKFLETEGIYKEVKQISRRVSLFVRTAVFIENDKKPAENAIMALQEHLVVMKKNSSRKETSALETIQERLESVDPCHEDHYFPILLAKDPTLKTIIMKAIAPSITLRDFFDHHDKVSCEKLPFTFGAHVFLELCHILELLHLKYGITHNDIRLENILIRLGDWRSPDQKYPYFALVDFDQAQLRGSGSHMIREMHSLANILHDIAKRCAPHDTLDYAKDLHAFVTKKIIGLSLYTIYQDYRASLEKTTQEIGYDKLEDFRELVKGAASSRFAVKFGWEEYYKLYNANPHALP